MKVGRISRQLLYQLLNNEFQKNGLFKRVELTVKTNKVIGFDEIAENSKEYSSENSCHSSLHSQKA